MKTFLLTAFLSMALAGSSNANSPNMSPTMSTVYTNTTISSTSLDSSADLQASGSYTNIPLVLPSIYWRCADRTSTPSTSATASRPTPCLVTNTKTPPVLSHTCNDHLETFPTIVPTRLSPIFPYKYSHTYTDLESFPHITPTNASSDPSSYSVIKPRTFPVFSQTYTDLESFPTFGPTDTVSSSLLIVPCGDSFEKRTGSTSCSSSRIISTPKVPPLLSST